MNEARSANVDMADYSAGWMAPLLARRAIFLSASEPYMRADPADRKLNEEYVRTARPHNILDAVSYLCRLAFTHDLNLVFGAHPAISPMVLDMARRFAESSDPGEPRVMIFQSDFFREKIPVATRKLADSDLGILLWTREHGDRPGSLTHMRRVMVSWPSLIAGVFVGGMEGCEEEAALFTQRWQGDQRRHCYAIGSTGSAAARLLRRDPHRFCGERADAEALQGMRSYPVLMERIAEDLGLE
jgi:hypothetical protein